jgi:excisionase family DNA binding protein
MSGSQFISVRETAQLLEIPEKKVMDLIENRQLQAYRIANKFLRLKRAEVLALRNSGKVSSETVEYVYSLGEKIRDFFYYNDFYIAAIAIIIWLLSLIFYH